jgi:hypothetical protein
MKLSDLRARFQEEQENAVIVESPACLHQDGFKPTGRVSPEGFPIVACTRCSFEVVFMTRLSPEEVANEYAVIKPIGIKTRCDCGLAFAHGESTCGGCARCRHGFKPLFCDHKHCPNFGERCDCERPKPAAPDFKKCRDCEKPLRSAPPAVAS